MLTEDKWNEIFSDPRKLVVEIGANIKPQARFVEHWKDENEVRVLTLDIDPEQKPDIVADAGDMPPELYGKLDGILASHVLEHFSYWRTLHVLEGWVKCLKDGGELHVLVPSLEWAARQILSESPSPAVYAQLYAGQVNQWDVHLTGFTMRKLRQLFEKIGLSVHTARTGVYHVNVGDQGIFPAEQHYIVGVKGEPPLRRE